MNLPNDKISEILLKEAYVSEKDLSTAKAYTDANKTSILDYLIEKELITRDLFGQAMAEYFGIPYADLNSKQPSHELVLRLDENTAKEHRLVFFKETEKEVVIATDNPKKEGLGQILKQLFPNKKVVVAFALSEDIDNTFISYKKSLNLRFAKIIESDQKIAPELIDEIFKDAILYKASDIHFEPQEVDVAIRFRIDGLLQEAGRVSKEFYENILNRIKVQAHIRIDEHYSAQDGAIRYVKEDISVDLRVSITPTLDGEKVVIRVLSKYVTNLSLGDLGFLPKDQEMVSESIKKPFGMILTTGPTGSGKTTTLYTLLRSLNKPDVNITTIEDPVEFKIKGVNQIQVNQQTNLTFSKGLRSIVRQDPDIILVGEIRDRETAEIAVNAALTGHLLLSTFHSNDAATAIPRLIDMGVEPFLLASTLEVIIAQRLVRKICESCRYSHILEKDSYKNTLLDIDKVFGKEKITVYKGKGCDICNKTGYKGRIAIFEFIKVTPEMQDLIIHNPSTKQIWDLARSQGAKSLFEYGIERVKGGVTTLEEVLRVAPPPAILELKQIKSTKKV